MISFCPSDMQHRAHIWLVGLGEVATSLDREYGIVISYMKLKIILITGSIKYCKFGDYIT